MIPIHFAHSNGFPASTYSHFFKYLAPHPISFVECLGHGEFRVKTNWRPLGDEIITAIETQADEPVIGLGHSLGAVSIFFAAQKRPDLFKKIIMMDPPITKPLKRLLFVVARSTGLISLIPSPALKAKKRKRNFRSKEEAYTYWRKKKLFQPFKEECFKDYVEHGLKPEGDRFTLTFSADLEYKFFCTAPGRLGKTRIEIPSFFIYSSSHQVLQPADIEANKRVFDNTTFIPADGGHMFPLEKPEDTATIIKSIINP